MRNNLEVSIKVGECKNCPKTKMLQKKFFDIVEGRTEDTHGWLTLVPKGKGV